MHPPAPNALTVRIIAATYLGATDQMSAVRADLRELLGDCPLRDDVILCASELAANAALHSRSRLPGGAFTVRVKISPGEYARIEVEDNGGVWTGGVADHGRHHGLDIVRTLASDWGIDGDCTARTVWARLYWPARA
jgi:hypothetical protein